MQKGGRLIPRSVMRAVRSIILSVTLLAALAAAERACAQYYSWGADPARFRWMRAETEGADVIYPDHTPEIGLSTLRLVERMRPYISYGYRLPALDIPFVVHPENMRSNGLVMWLPKRVEFLSAPAVDGYSMPWIKQLVAHEYRHAVQYNNLNVGFVKFLSRLLGQQSSTIGLLYMPLWMIEGDATMSETQASSFGRGKQPRFTLEFRAMGDIATKYRNTDKFFCGSYRDFIPDHYQLGYQLVSYGNETTGRVICDEIAHTAAPSVDGDLDGTHHAQALRLHHARSVPPHVRFAGRLLGLAARRGEFGRVPPHAAAAELYQIFRSHTRGGRYAAASEGGSRRSVALRAARRRHGRGAHAVPHGRGVDAPRLRPRLGTGLVDGIPTQQDVRRKGRVAYMLFRPRREPSPHRRHARQSALSPPTARAAWRGRSTLPTAYIPSCAARATAPRAVAPCLSGRRCTRSRGTTSRDGFI